MINVKLGSMTLYYNSNFGYILAPETTIKGSIIHTTLNPVMVEKADISIEILGNKIFESLKMSRESEPVNRSDIKDFKFWQVSGVKGFSAFSKKFKCIDITEKNDKLGITKLIRDKDGSYSYPSKDLSVELQTDISNEELGKKILELFMEDENKINYEYMSFMSLNEKQINYIRPSDNFEDAGDGHTDAYQIYTYDCNDKNYLAFLIDNGYSDFTENAIKQRWQQMYGTLIEFEFQFVSNMPERIKVKGKTKSEMIVSHIYQDGEGMLEVVYEIDLTNTIEKEMIEKEFEKVIASIKIQ